MSQPQATLCSADEERALHQRLLAEDPIAPSDLAVTYLDGLTHWLVTHNSSALDPHTCATAAADAIITLIKNPHTYHPARAGLEAYLRMSAQRRLQNLLRSERRHSSRKATWDAVEVSPEMGKYLRDEESDPALIVLRHDAEQEVARQLSAVPASVRARLTPQEEMVCELMREKERKTAVYAAVLGLTNLPPAQQRRDVKRVKDRLAKRLGRARDQHD